MDSMCGIFDMDKMDDVLPMGPMEQQQYLADLRAVVDADRLEEFLLGVIIASHTCGYDMRMDEENYFDSEEG